MLITNFDEIHRGHEFFLAQNERLLVDSEQLAGRFAQDYVRTNSDFTRRSGKLQDKTTFRIVKTSGGRILRIANNVPYAQIIESGSRAHEIHPRQTTSRTTGLTSRGTALAFMGRAGVMVFRRSVKHPGTRPYKFLWNATDAAYRVLGQELIRGMTDIAERF